MLLNETKLSYHHHIEFKDYITIRQDRTTNYQGGGTAILLKETFKHEHILNSKIQQFTGVEVTIVKITLQNNEKLYVIAIYCTSNKQILTPTKFEEEWNNLFKILNLNNTKNYYVNARHLNWGNDVNDRRGVKLNQWLSENDIVYRAKLYKPSTPTIPRTGNYIDVAIVDNRLSVSTDNNGDITTLTYDSDHKAILVYILNNGHILNNTTEKQHTTYNFSNMH